MVDSFGGLQPYLFEPEKPNLRQDSSNQLQVTGNVYIKKDTSSFDWCSCKNCHLENREIDCLYCQNVAAIDEQKLECKKRFTFMFPCHKLYGSSHSIVFYKLGDNHQILLQILAECLKITRELGNFYKARIAKVKLLHRCFPKVSLIVVELLKHF